MSPGQGEYQYDITSISTTPTLDLYSMPHEQVSGRSQNAIDLGPCVAVSGPGSFGRAESKDAIPPEEPLLSHPPSQLLAHTHRTEGADELRLAMLPVNY